MRQAPSSGVDALVGRAARELLDDRGAERVEVVRLAAGHQVAVDDDLLVHPPGAGVAQVGLQRRPRPHPPAADTSASASTQGAWQIAATGLPASKNDFTNATASASARMKSPLITPPGSTSAA